MSGWSDRKALGVGATAALVVVTGYLGLVGYGLGRSLRVAPWGTFYTALTVASLGAVLVAAWRRGVRVAGAGGVLALVADPIWPFFAPSPFGRSIPLSVSQLLPDLLVLSVALPLAAAVEYAVRNPVHARNVLTPGAVRAGIAAGVVHLILVVTVRTWLGAMVWAFPTLFEVVTVLWILLGAFLVGALAGVLFQRYRLVTPSLVVVSLFSPATYRTWTYVQAHGDTHFPSWFTAYMVLWFVVAALALSAGLVEHRTGTRTADVPPPRDGSESS